MWQSPNQRVRAIAASKKRERERLAHRIHIRRVAVHLKVHNFASTEGTAVPARVVLNDLSGSGVGLFTTQQLSAGQEVTIVLSEPKPLQVRGKVISCQEYDTGSHILSEHTYTYRIGVQFVFESPEKEREVQEYYQSIIGELRGSKAA